MGFGQRASTALSITSGTFHFIKDWHQIGVRKDHGPLLQPCAAQHLCFSGRRGRGVTDAELTLTASDKGQAMDLQHAQEAGSDAHLSKIRQESISIPEKFPSQHCSLHLCMHVCRWRRV